MYRLAKQEKRRDSHGPTRRAATDLVWDICFVVGVMAFFLATFPLLREQEALWQPEGGDLEWLDFVPALCLESSNDEFRKMTAAVSQGEGLDDSVDVAASEGRAGNASRRFSQEEIDNHVRTCGEADFMFYAEMQFQWLALRRGLHVGGLISGHTLYGEGTFWMRSELPYVVPAESLEEILPGTPMYGRGSGKG
jgi:hypothetical protein